MFVIAATMRPVLIGKEESKVSSTDCDVYQPTSSQNKPRDDLAAGGWDQRIRAHDAAPSASASTLASASSACGSSEDAVRLISAQAKANPNPPLLVNTATIIGVKDGFNVYKISVPKITGQPLELGWKLRPSMWKEAGMGSRFPTSAECVEIESVKKGY